MTVLRKLLTDLEEYEPALFHVMDGEKAQRELDELTENAEVKEPGVTLVRINGKAQEIVDTDVIGSRYARLQTNWMYAVPVVIVQERNQPQR